MHECPACGFECDCDGEDLVQPAPELCRCAMRDIAGPSFDPEDALDDFPFDQDEGCDFCRSKDCNCEAFDEPEELTP